MFFDYVLYVLFFAIPLLTIGFFLVSLFRFLSAKRANKKTPGAFGAEEIKRRKLLFIVSAVTSGVFAAVVIGIIVLLCMAIAYM